MSAATLLADTFQIGDHGTNYGAILIRAFWILLAAGVSKVLFGGGKKQPERSSDQRAPAPISVPPKSEGETRSAGSIPAGGSSSSAGVPVDHLAHIERRNRETLHEAEAQEATKHVETPASSTVERLQTLSHLRAEGLVSDEIYEAKRQQILQEL